MIKTLPTFLVLLSLPAWAQNPGPVEGPPVCELISFRAEPEDRSMTVRWSTTGDALGDAFIVERSSDRMNWTATITEPVKITRYCDMDGSKNTHLSPMFHFGRRDRS